MTTGSVRISAGVPLAMSPPKSSTWIASQTLSTTDMSWSTSSTETPVHREGAEHVGQFGGLVVIQARCGFVEEQHLRP